MPVQFVLGRAGTGKTKRCFDAIEQWVREHGLGSSAILITPRQATQVAERQLVAAKPGRSLLGVRVVSLDWLVREVAPGLAESLDLLDGRGRRLLIALAIQQHAGDLKYFKRAERQPHLAARIDAALTEIEQSGASIDDIRKAIAPAAGAAQDKLSDLAIIQDAYTRLLGDRLDRHRLDALVIEAIRQSPLIAQSLIVVDGFADFTPMQRRMILTLAAHASRTEIALLDDPDETDGTLFARTRRTYQRLMAELRNSGVSIEPPLILEGATRFASPELAAVERAFESGPAYTGSPTSSVRIVEAASDLEEVRFAAEQVRRWQIAGARLREIGVFCRDLEPYAQWVRPIFAEYGIPCFIDQQRSLGEHPLMRYVRAVLRIAMDGWRTPGVLELLKCGMSPLQAHEVDRLENFALRHGIDRRQWLDPWDALVPPAKEDEEPEDKADREREANETQICAAYRVRAVEVLKPVVAVWESGDRIAPKALTAALRQLVGSDSVQRRIDQWKKDLPDSADEHAECLKALHELFDACDLLLGSSVLPRRQTVEMLLAAMEDMHVKLAPPTLDQVLVGQIDRSRSPDFTRVIVLGMNEGTFPAKASEDSVFNDNERQALDAAGVELNADSELRAISEQLTGYIAMTRASNELVLSRPRTDDSGRKLAASGFLARVRRILPKISVEQAALAADPKVDTGRAAAAAYSNEPSLDPAVAAELLGDQLNCSATRLELQAACPFRHFLERSLRLKEREVAEISSLDLGNAFHFVLQKIAEKMIADHLDWNSPELEAHLDEYIEAVAHELRGQVLLSNARNRYQLNVIKRMLLKLIADQRLLSAPGYTVTSTELSFGESDSELSALSIKTPKGRTVRLRGRIDRVDCSNTGGTYLVFDYKSSEKRLRLEEVEQGLSLQLLIYWLVLEENGKPVDAALYQQLMRPMHTESAPTQNDLTKVSCKPRGLISFEAKERLDPYLEGYSKLYGLYVTTNGQLGNEHSTDAVRPADLNALQEFVRAKIGELADSIFDGEIGIAPYQIGNRSPCPYCPYRAICRFDTRYNKYHTITPSKRTEVLDRLNPAREEDKPTEIKKKRKGKVHA